MRLFQKDFLHTLDYHPVAIVAFGEEEAAADARIGTEFDKTANFLAVDKIGAVAAAAE